MDLLGTRQFYALAIACYAVATVHGIFLWRRGLGRGEWVNYGWLTAGWLLQVLALVTRGFSLSRCPVTNLFEAVMFVTTVIGLAHAVAGLWRRFRGAGVLLAPAFFAVGVFALQPQLDKPGPVFDLEATALSLHVTLILIAYASFGLASLAAAMFLVVEHAGESAAARVLAANFPHSERLQAVLLKALAGGLLLLTAGLILSLGLMRERYGVLVRPDPKIAWSVFVWAVYFGLIVARLRFGQGPRRVAWATLCCYAFVILTFWGTNLLSPIHHP
ncbi:MAG: cytochrome c biogenesis protein CcsA [Verrucomicrobiales bacterium]|nr:cytochrome c biogenesis protein CcsA [Verrucomicrobiales bacterium]